MTLQEIIDKAQALTVQERKVLINAILDSFIDPPLPTRLPTDHPHWGRALNTLLDEVGPITFRHAEIEDPVEWVAQMRTERRQRRLENWDGDQ